VLPVVLIHGLVGPLGDPRVWDRFAPREVIALDLLGYGRYAGTRAPIDVDAQVTHVRETVGDRRIHLVGHSSGGVIATAYTHRYAGSVGRFVNVEGNFTLADAFWSGQLARRTPEEVAQGLARDRGDPAGWLRGAGIDVSPERVAMAGAMLRHQPATTLHAMARSVVSYTGTAEWAAMLRDVFARVPVDLVAGGRSRAAWDVPPWALAAARSYTEIPDVGHLMMVEAPERFGTAVARLLDGDA
jgi:lipase